MQNDNDDLDRNTRIKRLHQEIIDEEVSSDFDIIFIRGYDNDLYNQD